MATRKAGGKTPDPELIQRALVKARATLTEKGVAGGALLGAARLRPSVVSTLQEEGFELVGNKVRVRLESQLIDLVSSGAHTPLTQLQKRLSGTTAAEAKRLATKLTLRGDAQLVLREKVLTLVPKTEVTLAQAELKQLVTEMDSRLKWLKKAMNGKAPAGVLKADLKESLTGWSQLASAERSPQATLATPKAVAPKTNHWKLIRGALLALANEDTGLARVPEIGRRLHVESPAVDLKAELLEAYQNGLVELRPEGGIGRLSIEDAALCPTGAGGIPLSWIRLLEEVR